MLSIAFLAILGLWATYEVLNSYSLKRQEREDNAATISKIIQEIIRSEIKDGRIDRSRLSKILGGIVNSTDIEHLRVDCDGETVLAINDCRETWHFNL